MVPLLKVLSRKSNKAYINTKHENTFDHLDKDVKEYLNNKIQEYFYNIFKYMVLKSLIFSILFILLTIVNLAKKVGENIMSKIFTDEILLDLIEHDLFDSNKIQKI